MRLSPPDARSASPAYRPDIDGLRGVAVLAVVAYHAFPHAVPGGFVGVDVFFVISGFLISSQLFDSAADGTFSFRDFYVRRLRRLVPALLIVLAATAVLGWFALTPDEFASLRTHLAASTFFGNNLLLWSEAGYFDGPSELKPLLHLWSLGIEEQFYLVWPLLVWAAWRHGRVLVGAIATIAVVSFLLNLFLVSRGRAVAAFFLPTSRFWELAAGALLAALARPVRVVSAQPPSTTRTLASLLGLAMIVVSVGVLNRETPAAEATSALWSASAAGYPGWWALAPTLGTVLIVWAGLSSWSNATLLGSRLLVAIGLVSYPLYLWHWPLLAFMNITELREVPSWFKFTAIALSLGLAWLTYVWIEQPIRRSVTVRTPWRVAALAVPLVAFGSIMVWASITGAIAPPYRTVTRVDEPATRSQNELLCKQRFGGGGDYCQLYSAGDLPVTTAVLGDSHSQALYPGIAARLSAIGENVVHMGQAGCLPILNLEQVRVGQPLLCVEQTRRIVETVVRDPQIRRVILVFRGALAVSGHSLGPEALTQARFRMVGTDWPNDVSIREGLRETTTRLLAAGKHVIVAMPIPELGFQPAECTERPLHLQQRPVRQPCATPATAIREHERPFREIVEQLAAEFPIQVFDPGPRFCDAEQCHAIVAGRVVYFDDNHVGMTGSTLAAQALAIDSTQ